jgi:hypothetical protein
MSDKVCRKYLGGDKNGMILAFFVIRFQLSADHWS